MSFKLNLTVTIFSHYTHYFFPEATFRYSDGRTYHRSPQWKDQRQHADAGGNPIPPNRSGHINYSPPGVSEGKHESFLTEARTATTLHLTKVLSYTCVCTIFFPRRKRRDFDRSVRTPTVKCCGGLWCRPPSCCRWDSGRSNDSKISSSPRSSSNILLWPAKYNSACFCHR